MVEESQPLLQSLLGLFASFIDFLPEIIAAVVLFILSLVVASLAGRAVRRSIERRTKNPQPVVLLSQLTYWTVVLFGLVLALQQVGFNLTAFLAGLGVAGFTIGFALQDVSKNFIAGLLMLIQQPFSTGDVIEVSGYTGTVLQIDLRATHLRTLDGLLVLIPNADIFVSPITNFTQSESRRVEITAGVAYESDPEKVRRVVIDAIRGIPGRIDDPPAEVLFQGFGSSTIDLTVYYWIDTSQISPVQAKDAGLVAIKRAFEVEMIEMPFPTQAIYVRQPE